MWLVVWMALVPLLSLKASWATPERRPDANLRWQVIQITLKERKNKEAILHLENFVKKDFEHDRYFEARRTLAKLYLETHQPKKAIQLLHDQKGLAEKTLLAEAFLQNRQFHEAILAATEVTAVPKGRAPSSSLASIDERSSATLVEAKARNSFPQAHQKQKARLLLLNIEKEGFLNQISPVIRTDLYLSLYTFYQQDCRETLHTSSRKTEGQFVHLLKEKSLCLQESLSYLLKAMASAPPGTEWAVKTLGTATAAWDEFLQLAQTPPLPLEAFRGKEKWDQAQQHQYQTDASRFALKVFVESTELADSLLQAGSESLTKENKTELDRFLKWLDEKRIAVKKQLERKP